jgi:hypothetical protein
MNIYNLLILLIALLLALSVNIFYYIPHYGKSMDLLQIIGLVAAIFAIIKGLMMLI